MLVNNKYLIVIRTRHEYQSCNFKFPRFMNTEHRSVNVDNDDGIFLCLTVLVDSLDKLVLIFLMVFVL